MIILICPLIVRPSLSAKSFTNSTISASMAFMMPVATPPNAIVFGSQRLHISDMARVGLIINLIGVGLTTIAAYVLLPLAFGVN